MTTIPALIEKLRGLKGPSPELDAEIAITVGGYVHEKRGRDRKAWFYAPTPALALLIAFLEAKMEFAS